MSYNDVYNRYMREANAYAEQYGLVRSTAHNGAWDAFRHAYSSAEMAREYSSAFAHAAGELNEIRGDYKHDQPSYERNMDEWNNAVGREIGKDSKSSAESAQRVYDALKKGDLITDPIVDPRDYKDSWDKINDQMRDWWDRATNWRWLRDPLTLDLDNDGLETLGINAAAPILFDHDGTGIKTASGWLKPDDAFLVLDRNGNGLIDSGRELFGDATLKSNGQLARDGFDALADLDGNADGQISTLDSAYARLKLWRDLNQDGVSQANELSTLGQAGIASIKVVSSAHSQTLANGNEIADLGTLRKRRFIPASPHT